MDNDFFLTVMGTIFTGICGYIATSLGKMNESVRELNIKLAVVIERLEYHDERLKRLEERE
jgi:hypothetical protein